MSPRSEGCSKRPEEELEAGSESSLISHRLWQTRFGGDPDVVGRRLFLNGEPRTIVGVVPAGFRFMADVDVWIPVERGDFFIDSERDAHSLLLVARLKPGVTMAQAQAEVDAIAAELERLYPDTNKGKGVILYDLQRYMVGDARTNLYLLMATTALVLLIAQQAADRHVDDGLADLARRPAAAGVRRGSDGAGTVGDAGLFRDDGHPPGAGAVVRDRPP